MSVECVFQEAHREHILLRTHVFQEAHTSSVRLLKDTPMRDAYTHRFC
jgi:hypothetical protein